MTLRLSVEPSSERENSRAHTGAMDAIAFLLSLLSVWLHSNGLPMLRDRSLLPLVVVGLFACRPEPVYLTPPETTQPDFEAPVEPQLDVAKMMEHIGWLASDELQGRFTFDPTIETTAAWLVEQYRQMGL